MVVAGTPSVYATGIDWICRTFTNPLGKPQPRPLESCALRKPGQHIGPSTGVHGVRSYLARHLDIRAETAAVLDSVP